MKQLKEVKTVMGRKIGVIQKSELFFKGSEYFPLSPSAGNTRLKAPDNHKVGIYLKNGTYDGMRSENRKQFLQAQVDKANQVWGNEVQKIAILDSIQSVQEIDPIAVDKALKCLKFSFSIVENGIARTTYKSKHLQSS